MASLDSLNTHYHRDHSLKLSIIAMNGTVN